jgi:hypothetical protein
MAISHHMIRSGDAQKGYVAYCGHKQFSNIFMTEPGMGNCSRCSSRYFSEKIKAADFPYRLGDRPDLSGDNRRWTYKSIYPIIRKSDEAVLGFVTIKQGWGKTWNVQPWSSDLRMTDVEADAIPKPVMNSGGVQYKRKPDDVREISCSFNSKEEALVAVPMLVAQAKLPSYAEVEIETARNASELRTRLAASEQRRKTAADQRAEDLALITEEFTGLLAGTLSNRQRMALMKAAELIGIKLQ